MTRLYAIHGLKDDVGTWKHPKEGFNWLEHLSQYLVRRGGQEISTFTVGWNTTVLSRTNYNTKISDSVRSLAGTIVGKRGESGVRVPLKLALCLELGHDADHKVPAIGREEQRQPYSAQGNNHWP